MHTFLIRLIPLCCIIHNCSQALIHHLQISKDNRKLFKIEDFGFFSGGTIKLDVRDFQIFGKGPFKAGFLLKQTKSESSSQQDLEKAVEFDTCLLDEYQPSVDFLLDMSDESNWGAKTFEQQIPNGLEGLYSLLYVRCLPVGETATKFHLDATFYNPGPNYLQAGDAPLPHVFLFCFFCFMCALVVWIYNLIKHKSEIHKIHHMMSALLIFKVASLLFESIRYHYIKVSGASEVWSIVVFTFAFLKGIMLFAVILLIGTGWTLMKPYLNTKEKHIIFVVLTLQVLNNVAMVVLEETAPGSQGWLTWRDVLHLVDIICCCAVLFPIVWSIRHLKDAAGADGKASTMLNKLKMFRQFYIVVITYIYFTRIIVFLVAATMPFKLLWLRFIFSEMGTLAFFVWTGVKFRPMTENPYLKVDTEDTLEEFGLDADAQELHDMRAETKAGRD